MMFNVISTGSKANGYVLQNDNEALVIECGCKFDDCLKVVGYNVRKIVGAVISHEHQDHSQCVKEYLQSGIKVYGSDETKTALEVIAGERIKAIQPMKKCRIGNFIVIPFEVPHDEELTNYGYLIEHEDIGKMLFLTDLMMCPYNFQKQKVEHIFCECNYAKELVFDNYEQSVRNRVLQTHMELNTFLDFIKANKSEKLRNVVLLHLSNSNSDDELFLEKTREIVSCDTYIAKKGLQIELSLPF